MVVVVGVAVTVTVTVLPELVVDDVDGEVVVDELV